MRELVRHGRASSIVRVPTKGFDTMNAKPINATVASAVALAFEAAYAVCEAAEYAGDMTGSHGGDSDVYVMCTEGNFSVHVISRSHTPPRQPVLAIYSDESGDSLSLFACTCCDMSLASYGTRRHGWHDALTALRDLSAKPAEQRGDVDDMTACDCTR